MHCIRAFFSIVLLVSSLSWFTLRSLLSLSTNINDLFGDSVDFEQFKKDWCKIRRQKIEWREVLSPCMDILNNATLNGNARYMHKSPFDDDRLIRDSNTFINYHSMRVGCLLI